MSQEIHASPFEFDSHFFSSSSPTTQPLLPVPHLDAGSDLTPPLEKKLSSLAEKILQDLKKQPGQFRLELYESQSSPLDLIELPVPAPVEKPRELHLELPQSLPMETDPPSLKRKIDAVVSQEDFEERKKHKKDHPVLPESPELSRLERKATLDAPQPQTDEKSASLQGGVLQPPQAKVVSPFRKRNLDFMADWASHRKQKKPKVDLPAAPQELSALDQKLFRTFKKGLKEQGIDESKLPDLSVRFTGKPFHLQFNEDVRQGIRPSMEDAHFHAGRVWGIFDGHGDEGEIAAMASHEIQTELPRLLKERPHEMKNNFKEIFRSIHEKITRSGGATALVCYVDALNRLITACLGDSKVVVVRKIGDKFYWIPVTREKNWSHPKEAARAEAAIGDSQIFQQWSQIQNPKLLYFPPIGVGVNVSRSLGDKDKVYEGRSAISQTPDVTLFQLQEGDLIISGCDGLWDFAHPNQLLEVIKKHWGMPDMAKRLADYILPKSTDNISIICTHVKKSRSKG